MIKAKVQGILELEQKMRKLSKGVKDLSPAFEDMSGLIVQEFTANFNESGRVLGEPWPPRKREYSWPLLIKTGNLKAGGSGGWTKKPEKKKLTIINPVEYAAYHNFGTKTLPVRKLVGPSVNIIKIATTRIIKYLKTLISFS